MLIRKYRAKNLKEALNRVKVDLGDDATVLSTRTIRVGLLSNQVEVTATPAEVKARGPRPRPARSTIETPGVDPRELLASRQPRATLTGGQGLAPVEAAEPTMGAQGYTRAAMPVALETPMGAPEPAPEPSAASGGQSQMQRMLTPLRRDIRSLTSQVRSLTYDTDNSDKIVDMVNYLKQVLEAVNEEGELMPFVATYGARNKALASMATRLEDSGFRHSLANEVMIRVGEGLPDDPADDDTRIEGVTAQVLAEDLRTVAGIEHHTGPRRVVALVGPTGVGKTSTLIKIAARASLIHDRSVGVIGCDTTGIGAVPALQETARHIGVPCCIARDAAEMADAKRELAANELILVDTAGLSARDTGGIESLGDQFAAAEVDPILLLNADMRGLEVDATIQGFRPMGPTALIFTKLDQAMGLGGLYDAALSSALPVMYLTNGREIPNDIEEADAQRMASMIMGVQYN